LATSAPDQTDQHAERMEGHINLPVSWECNPAFGSFEIHMLLPSVDRHHNSIHNILRAFITKLIQPELPLMIGNNSSPYFQLIHDYLDHADSTF
jgi:hypothetical protein